MIKNLILAALVAHTLVPYAHYVIDPKPIAVRCLAEDTGGLMCGLAVHMWAMRDGYENAHESMFLRRQFDGYAKDI